MQESIKIMDVDVDMLSNDVFVKKMNEYLSDDHLDVIMFASTELLNMTVEDEKYHALIDRAELFLPGEEALLSAHHVDILEAGDMVVSCRSFGIVLENLRKKDRTIYIIAKNMEKVRKLKRYCKKMQPRLRIVGTCAYEEQINDAAVVNEVNSHTPDFLLVDLDVGMQEEWIIEHVPMLNATLCITVGGVSDLILSEQKKIPQWVKKLHLGGLFQKIVREQKVKKGIRARDFRKKVVEYNQKQEEEIQKQEEEKQEEKKED